MTTHDFANAEPFKAREPSLDELLGEVLDLIDQVVDIRLADGELARRRTRIKNEVDRVRPIQTVADFMGSLRRLITHRSTGTEEAYEALAALFATMVDNADDAGKAIAMLDYALLTGNSQLRAATMPALLAVLSVRDPHSGRLSVFVYLHRHPARVDVIARLWAVVLCHPMYRGRAVAALVRGLKELSGESVEDVRIFGDALSRSLPPRERFLLASDLTTVNAASHCSADRNYWVRLAILASIERARLLS